MLLSYRDIFGDGERHRVEGKFTIDDPASSNGQPVLLVNGEVVDATSWRAFDCHVLFATGDEMEQLRRSDIGLWIDRLKPPGLPGGQC